MNRRMTVRIRSLYFLIFVFLILIGCLTFFSACDIGRRYDNQSVVDGVVLLRNKLYKKSLAAYCEWDGDLNNMQFSVPDEYCGYKVKCLGAKGNPGFTGDPGSFGVRLPNNIDGYEGIVRYGYEPDFVNSENTTLLNFTINIGKSVNELEQISRGGLYGYGIKNGGNHEVKRFYRVKIHYIIDSNNATFYSKDGDIYYKSSGKMIEYRF